MADMNENDKLEQLLREMRKTGADANGVDDIPSAAPSGPSDQNTAGSTPAGDNMDLGDPLAGDTPAQGTGPVKDPLVAESGVTVGDNANPPAGDLGVQTAAPQADVTEIKTAAEMTSRLDAAIEKHGLAKVAAAVIGDFEAFAGSFAKRAEEEAAFAAAQRDAQLDIIAKRALDEAEAGSESSEGGESEGDGESEPVDGGEGEDGAGEAEQVIGDMADAGLTEDDIANVVSMLDQVPPEALAQLAEAIDSGDVSPEELEAVMASDPASADANADAAMESAVGIDDQADAHAQTLAALQQADQAQAGEDASMAALGAGDPTSPEVEAMSSKLAEAGVTPEDLASKVASDSSIDGETKVAVEKLCQTVNLRRNMENVGKLRITKRAGEAEFGTAERIVGRFFRR